MWQPKSVTKCAIGIMRLVVKNGEQRDVLFYLLVHSTWTVNFWLVWDFLNYQLLTETNKPYLSLPNSRAFFLVRVSSQEQFTVYCLIFILQLVLWYRNLRSCAYEIGLIRYMPLATDILLEKHVLTDLHIIMGLISENSTSRLVSLLFLSWITRPLNLILKAGACK